MKEGELILLGPFAIREIYIRDSAHIPFSHFRNAFYLTAGAASCSELGTYTYYAG